TPNTAENKAIKIAKMMTCSSNEGERVSHNTLSVAINHSAAGHVGTATFKVMGTNNGASFLSPLIVPVSLLEHFNDGYGYLGFGVYATTDSVYLLIPGFANIADLSFSVSVDIAGSRLDGYMELDVQQVESSTVGVTGGYKPFLDFLGYDKQDTPVSSPAPPAEENPHTTGILARYLTSPHTVSIFSYYTGFKFTNHTTVDASNGFITLDEVAGEPHLTVTADGVYKLLISLSVSTVIDTTLLLRLFVNGVPASWQEATRDTCEGQKIDTIAMMGALSLSAGDRIELRAKSSNGTTEMAIYAANWELEKTDY
ncbi:MAG: hypothetical protein KAH32_05510, partial [Chlamydiia bacterium]|nr:hypothetical protein [Chlamydiia bacterium]